MHSSLLPQVSFFSDLLSMSRACTFSLPQSSASQNLFVSFLSSVPRASSPFPLSLLTSPYTDSSYTDRSLSPLGVQTKCAAHHTLKLSGSLALALLSQGLQSAFRFGERQNLLRKHPRFGMLVTVAKRHPLISTIVLQALWQFSRLSNHISWCYPGSFIPESTSVFRFPTLTLSLVEPFAPWLDLVNMEVVELNLKEAASSCQDQVETSLGNQMGTVTDQAVKFGEEVWEERRILGLEVSFIIRLLEVCDT